MLVDSRKLEAVRDVIDVCLVETALEQGLSRLGAAAALVDRMGFAIRLLPRDGRWIAYAISRDVYRRALELAVQGATISATGTELLEREPWHYESPSRDDAIVATLCRLLNENADIGADDGAAQATDDHAARYAAMGLWFEAVKGQWAKLATHEPQTAGAPARSI